MAIPEDQIGREGREAWRNNAGRRETSNMTGIALVIALLFAGLLLWFIYSGPPAQQTGSTTSTSQTTNAGPDANRVPNPNNAPKQQ